MDQPAKIVAGPPGVYFVAGQEWQVGDRYELLRVLGSGSFSCVAMALQKDTGEQVALKRIADVLASPENAKRVLREVCILRRLCHPNVIGLLDVFTKPSQTGKFVFKKGRLVASSVDLYLVTEFCDQGDLFHMRGQLAEIEVKQIMWQLLQALKYLHSNNVWHRDIKTANALTMLQSGFRVVKLADFGSARSAIDDKAAQHLSRRSAALEALPMRHSDSFLVQGSPSPGRYPPPHKELYVQPAPGGSQGGFTSPLTRVVCTPCYRAPEVVMSRGNYSSAIDMWSVGCVFGELLQRVAYLGKATTPHLQVAPVFAISGMPNTPEEGDKLQGAVGDTTTRRELNALFDVIGTPAWACIDGVQSDAWRNYLKNIPGRAPTLYRRFGPAGEVAVDLLGRLLTFDPARRCGADEALAHQYFQEFHARINSSLAKEKAEAMELEKLAACKALLPSASSLPLPDELLFPVDTLLPSPTAAISAARHDATAGMTAGEVVDAALGHYYNESDPAEALSLLEDEMADICTGGDAAGKLQELLERECVAHEQMEEARQAARATPPQLTPRSGSPTFLQRNGSAKSDWLPRGLLQADPGQTINASDIGQQRLPHHADTEQAKLEPAEHLRAGRHGEWTQTPLSSGPKAGPAWGVTLMPPGMDAAKATPEYLDVIRSQNKR